jgi:hypothetical protein
VAEVRERLVVNRQRSLRFHLKRFNLKKLIELVGNEKLAALKEVEINSAFETIRESIKISAKESVGYFEIKKHKPWFFEG